MKRPSPSAIAFRACARLGIERQFLAERLFGALQQRLERGVVEPMQHEDLAARQQRAVQLEGRVFRGRADQHHGAVLDIGQEAVLLRAVEAMDLVDEEQRALAADRGACAAPSNTLRRSATPENTAESGSKCIAVVSASRRAIVVLPQPGGPQRIIEASRRAATMRPIGASGASR